MQKRMALFFVFLFLSSKAVAMSAEDILYVTEEFPPYNFVSDGHVTGFAVETLRLMWEEMGVEPQTINVRSWARGMHDLETGKGVMLFLAAWSEEREREYYFVKPLLITESSLIASTSQKIEIKSAADLNQYSVGVVRSDLSERQVLEIGYPDEKLEKVSKLNLLAKMLKYNRLDIIGGEKRAIFNVLEEEGLEPGSYEVVHVLSLSENGYMLSKDVPPELVLEFQNALDSVRVTPEFEALMDEYF